MPYHMFICFALQANALCPAHCDIHHLIEMPSQSLWYALVSLAES